jgi:hypothetical protein
MEPIEKRELKRKAWMRLAMQRRRAGLLRGRVVVLSLICFAVLWGVVFAQMATGNDPVLSGKEKAAASSTEKIGPPSPRELEPANKARPREEEVLVEEAEPEFEAEPEAESVEAESFEAEPEFEPEPEPLITSQS